MDEIGSITDYIQDEAGLTADIIWGNCVDESLGDRVSVTIIATGFKTREEIGKEENKVKKIVTGLYDHVKETPSPAKKNVEKEIQEPMLLKKDEAADQETSTATQVEKEITFEFELPARTSKEDQAPPVPQSEERSVNRKEESHPEAEEEAPADSSTEEQLRKSRERIMKLKELSYRIGNANNLADMEKEPAYKRRNIKLDSVPHSSETNISRYTLSNEDEKKSEIKPNNSFLHDNVD
jgi:cell division protein FtsZ